MIGQILLWVLYEIFMSIPEGLAICRSSLGLVLILGSSVVAVSDQKLLPFLCLVGDPRIPLTNTLWTNAVPFPCHCLCQSHHPLLTVLTTNLTLVFNLVSGKILLKNDSELLIAILSNF